MDAVTMTYNHSHNILRLFDDFFYQIFLHHKWKEESLVINMVMPIASQVAEVLKS